MMYFEVLPSETVYSYVARYHLKVGVGHEKKTYSKLFDKNKIRIHPYLPDHLNSLNKVSTLSVHDWILRHTLYPLFKFFGHDKNLLLLQAMQNSGNVVSLAHIPHSKLTFEYGHKYCEICRQTSRSVQGFSYYDVRHQIPGINACYKHGCLLDITKGGDIGIDRHLMLPKLKSNITMANPIHIEFAVFCDQVLTTCRDMKYEPARLPYIYRKHLQEKGLITQNQQIRMRQTISLMAEYYKGFQFTKGLEPLASFSFLGPMLREKTHFPSHPIKHLLFAFWLFKKDASLFNHQLSGPHEEPPKPHITKVNNNKSIMSFLSQGKSMSEINKITGKSICYIRRVSELNGIKHQSNANSFSNRTRHSVIIQAQLGRHRTKIAQSLGVGIGYVEKVISNTKNLSTWRKFLAIQRKLVSTSQEIKMAKKAHPEWARKDFKSKHNQAFFFLYKYAKDILESLLPKKLKPKVPKRDWSQEDDRLYTAITNLENSSDLSITAIGHLINDHGHLRKKIDQLPRTRSLLLKLGKII